MSEDEHERWMHKPVAPLTDDEIEAVRLVLEKERNLKWIWQRARSIATMIAALVAGWLALGDAIKKSLGIPP